MALRNNDIRNEGARYLAEALQHNTVTYNLHIYDYYTQSLYFFQTLTQLSLIWNEILVEGARYLGEALQQNTVIFHIHIYCYGILHFGIDFRH